MDNEILISEPQADEVRDTDTNDENVGLTSDDNEAELERLRNEVRELNERLSEQQAQAEKIRKQIGDFCEAFPSVELNSVPQDVWESVKSGNSLAAAYALYTHRIQQKQARINEQNQKNAYLSAGYVGKTAANEYFTPDEVKKMSQGEVKANYSKILDSMKKWYK